MASVILKTTDLGIEVRCSECHQLLDRTPDERTAHCRAGKYLDHDCTKQGMRGPCETALSSQRVILH